jgi:hypothetical protein
MRLSRQRSSAAQRFGRGRRNATRRSNPRLEPGDSCWARSRARRRQTLDAGALWENVVGQAVCGRWASSPCFLGGRPCDLPGCAVSTYRSLSFARWFSVCAGRWRGEQGEIGRQSDRVRRASRFLRGRDRGGWCGALGGSRRDDAGATWAVRGESWPAGSGGVGGERECVGGRADPRAARRQGGRGESGGYGDEAGAREDRSAGRADAREAARGGRAGCGLVAGCIDAQAAPAAGAA